MMLPIATAISALLICALSVPIASAAGRQCVTPKHPYGTLLRDCRCGAALAKLHLASPIKQLPLDTVCNHKKVGGELTGNFLFAGQYRVAGELIREHTKHFGDTVYFVGPALDSKQPFFGGRVDFRFPDNLQAAASFHAPALSDTHDCWAAKVVLLVKQVFILSDGGSDGEGNYLLQYQIIDLGGYAACTNSEDNWEFASPLFRALK